MQTQIVKWGNGQGIRIPKKIMQELNLHINDICEMTVEGNQIVFEKKFRHRTLEERASEFGGKLGPYKEADWGDPQGQEVW